MKKAVIWDLDDTLYSRVEAARKTFFGMFATLLYPGREEAFIGQAVAYMMTRVLRNSMVHETAFQALLEKYPPDVPYVRAACLDYYYAHIAEFAKPFPEIPELLPKLRALGLKTAIVTNVTPDRLSSQKRKVEALGIGHLFDAIVYSGEYGINKPDRRIFDHAAGLLGVDPSRCLFVGDDPTSDISGALGAGIEAVWVDRWNDGNVFEKEPRVHRVSSAAEFFCL